MNGFRYIPVVALLVAAIALSSRRGDVPLALRGLKKTLGGSAAKPETRPVAPWRRVLAFVCVVVAFALCVL